MFNLLPELHSHIRRCEAEMFAKTHVSPFLHFGVDQIEGYLSNMSGIHSRCRQEPGSEQLSQPDIFFNNFSLILLFSYTNSFFSFKDAYIFTKSSQIMNQAK